MEFRPRINERTGNPCCFVYDAFGRPTRPDDAHACDRCCAHFRLQEDTMNNNENDDNDTFDGTPPDPYHAGIVALRAASSAPSTPESRFAEQYQAERRARIRPDGNRRERRRVHRGDSLTSPHRRRTRGIRAAGSMERSDQSVAREAWLGKAVTRWPGRSVPWRAFTRRVRGSACGKFTTRRTRTPKRTDSTYCITTATTGTHCTRIAARSAAIGMWDAAATIRRDDCVRTGAA